MKRSLKSAYMTIALAGALPLAAQAQLSIGEDLNLDFSQEMESIEKINDTAAPMQKHLETGLTDLRSLINDVKSNPNALTKGKFEVQFAKHIQFVCSPRNPQPQSYPE